MVGHDGALNHGVETPTKVSGLLWRGWHGAWKFPYARFGLLRLM